MWRRRRRSLRRCISEKAHKRIILKQWRKKKVRKQVHKVENQYQMIALETQNL